MIPISSRVEKYEEIYQNKLIRYPNYDGIRFGYVNGQRRAFLIQNMCPVSQKYIDEEYRIEHNTVPVRINDALSAELNAIARKVIRLYKRGIRITLVDIGYILNILEQES